jgi:hypothetical protein
VDAPHPRPWHNFVPLGSRACTARSSSLSPFQQTTNAAQFFGLDPSLSRHIESGLIPVLSIVLFFTLWISGLVVHLVNERRRNREQANDDESLIALAELYESMDATKKEQ